MGLLMKESQVVQGLAAPLFSLKKNSLLQGRDVIDLGAVDVFDVRHDRGAVAVTLVQRGLPENESAASVTFEILPIAAEDFTGLAKRFLASLPEEYRGDVPTAESRRVEQATALGEVAASQVARREGGLEMAWTGVSEPRAVKCLITSGQLESLVSQVNAILGAMSEKDRGARLVRLEGWGTTRKIALEK